MKQISFSDFSTNRNMLDKDVLRYCETFCAYVNHIQTYFNEPLTSYENRIVAYLIKRIDCFLRDHPHGEKIEKISARYKRVKTRLEKIMSFEINRIVESKISEHETE